jgi:hypothetical protein
MENSESHLGEEKNPIPDYEFANQVSPGTIVRLLVKKGILSMDEVLREERIVRGQAAVISHSVDREDDQQGQRFAYLKNIAARHRLLRRTTSFLFGWKWKKRAVRESAQKTTLE